jgi:hypothetical protein
MTAIVVKRILPLAIGVAAEPAWGDRAYESKIHDYYGVEHYWTL